MPDGMKFLRTIAQNIRVQAHAIWLCARDPQLGWGPRLLAMLIAGYALSPIDLIPDFIPIIGLLDDAILLPLGVWLFLKLVPPEIFARNLALAEAAAQRPISRAGATVIIAIWLVAVALLLLWLI
jgi:uncharacterized membrane protein YkvA (DUF1232 family)